MFFFNLKCSFLECILKYLAALNLNALFNKQMSMRTDSSAWHGGKRFYKFSGEMQAQLTAISMATFPIANNSQITA